MFCLFPQLDALEFLHENEYVHGNVTADNIFVNPEDLNQVRARGPEQGGGRSLCIQLTWAPSPAPLQEPTSDPYAGYSPPIFFKETGLYPGGAQGSDVTWCHTFLS